ncbi:Aste57867_25318 [Aphanomyces stellatus]|uniref:Aste57867_25318 protein n=1 Tax=Aphanomyces stellatus TaxID=120398 RepID=A0A485LTS1_9STRA|nr:hypothetical protein As57867_025240 [Aphanomyces stellatus]VFU01943.1 Aste57867_25318 [Aphanomyces stellatus]
MVGIMLAGALNSLALLLCMPPRVHFAISHILPMTNNTSVQSTNWRTDTPFEGLFVRLPGRIVVSYNASLDAAATVSVVSDSAALLQLVSLDVDTTPASNKFHRPECDGSPDLGFPNATYLAIRAKSDVNVLASGTLVVHITLGQPIAWVDTHAEAILTNGTLVNGADRRVVIASVASGNVYIDAAYPVHLQSLALSAIGSGTVQFATPSLTTDLSLSLASDRPGSVVAVQADIVSALYLQTSAASGGAVFLKGTDGIRASNVHVDIARGGNVNMYPQGTCDSTWINIADAGHANTGSLVCQSAMVSTFGGGDVIVQALDSLTTTIAGSGSVQYFNATPAHLPKFDEGFSFFRPKLPTHTTNNSFDTYTFLPIPDDGPMQVLVELNQSQHSRCMHYRGQQATLGTTLQPAAIMLNSTMNTKMDILGIIALVCVALVATVVFKKAKKRTGYVALPK